MKLAFLGDSITEGVGASSLETNYVSQVGKMLGCEVLNYGIGGTRIARKKESSCPNKFYISMSGFFCCCFLTFLNLDGSVSYHSFYEHINSMTIIFK